MKDLNTKIMRTDPAFEKRLRELSTRRLTNKIDLDMKPRTLPDMTRMMLNAPSFKLVEEELIRMPRKEDLVRRKDL